jgi:hypothetical protein
MDLNAGQIWEQAQRNISDLRRRGGDYARMAAAEQAMLDEDMPEHGSVGDRCKGCREAWPCGVMWTIMEPE